MVGLNPSKRFKPKTHEWIGLRTHETKERKKKAQLANIRKSLGSLVVRTGPGYLGTAKSSGTLGRAAKLG